jgi:hypothetical protein
VLLNNPIYKKIHPLVESAIIAIYEGDDKSVTNGIKTAVMDVRGFLYLSLGGSIV